MFMKIASLALCFAVLSTLTATPVRPAAAASPDLAALGQGSATFTLNLYRQMLAEEKGNLFFSPYSITLALSLALAGAKGDTAAEMTRTLGLTLPPERLHPAMAELGSHLTKVGNEVGQTLSVANAGWLAQGLALRPEYREIIQKHYGSELRQLDFCQGEQSRQTINGWVAKITRDKIKDLIPPGILKCDTAMVLTNAIYFLGHWAQKFDPQQTKPAPFFLAPDKSVETPFMHRKGEYAYAEGDGWQALELPYRENQLSMVVLLPQTKGGLPALEQALTPEVLAKLTQALQMRQVQVSLPKFEVRSRLTLNPYLQAAGMRRAFSPGADFSGITASQGLFISAVLHQAWVKVEEKGTEAAAATAVIMTKSAAPPALPPVVFKADHPFLYFIKDRDTGLILFMGRLASP